MCHMKILRSIERIAHWFALFVGISAIVAIEVIISRPSQKSGYQPNFAGADLQQKRLVVFLDGTWNSVESNTNVWRMRALCASQGKDGKPQLVYYEIGVNGFLGGIFGQGMDENIRLAMSGLSKTIRRATKSSYSVSVGARIPPEAWPGWWPLMAS